MHSGSVCDGAAARRRRCGKAGPPVVEKLAIESYCVTRSDCRTGDYRNHRGSSGLVGGSGRSVVPGSPASASPVLSGEGGESGNVLISVGSQVKVDGSGTLLYPPSPIFGSK